MSKTIIVAMEIGTTNTVALVGEVLDSGRVRVTGIGSAKTTGVRKGLIVDMQQARAGVEIAVRQAEKSADIAIGETLLAVSGAHIVANRCENRRPVLGAGGKVTHEDVDELRKQAQQIPPEPGRIVLHTISQSYRLDELDNVPNPIDIRGKQLALGTIAVTAKQERIDDAVSLLKGLTIDTGATVFSVLGAATAVLSEEQRLHGAVLIDFGGGTTNYIAVNRKVVVAVGSLGVGGDHVTNDIAQAFGLPLKIAEELKISDGCAIIQEQQADRLIKMPTSMVSGAAQYVSTKSLHTVIEARMREILELVRDQLGVELRQCGAGVVCTGGGAYLLQLNELAGRVFGLPVQTGKLLDEIEWPSTCNLKPAAFATTGGLLLRSAQKQNDFSVEQRETFWGMFKSLFARFGRIFGHD